MLAVPDQASEVELRLWERRLHCPSCGDGVLGPWGFARERQLREADGALRQLRPRRARCRACQTTHVLVPTSMLVRRCDAVEVVGEALVAKAAGQSHRQIAAALARPASTVRGWLQRFNARAEELRQIGTTLAHDFDPEMPAIVVRGSPFADALEALGLAAAAAARRLGQAPLPGSSSRG